MKKRINEKDNDTLVKTFRFHKTTVEGLKVLTEEINKNINIKLSMNGLVELLIKNAISKDKGKIIKMINKVD